MRNAIEWNHLKRTLNSAPGPLLTYHSYQLEVSKNVPTFYSNSAFNSDQLFAC